MAGWIAKLTALLLVFLVAGNVLARYLFSLGSVGLQELEWHLISPIALFGISYGLRHDAHVRVDFLYERFPTWLQRGVDALASLLIIALAGIVVWLAIPYVQRAYLLGEGSPDPGGLPHRFLLKGLIPISFAVLGIQGLASLLRLFVGREEADHG